MAIKRTPENVIRSRPVPSPRTPRKETVVPIFKSSNPQSQLPNTQRPTTPSLSRREFKAQLGTPLTLPRVRVTQLLQTPVTKPQVPQRMTVDPPEKRTHNHPIPLPHLNRASPLRGVPAVPISPRNSREYSKLMGVPRSNAKPTANLSSIASRREIASGSVIKEITRKAPRSSPTVAVGEMRKSIPSSNTPIKEQSPRDSVATQVSQRQVRSYTSLEIAPRGTRQPLSQISSTPRGRSAVSSTSESLVRTQRVNTRVDSESHREIPHRFDSLTITKRLKPAHTSTGIMETSNRDIGEAKVSYKAPNNQFPRININYGHPLRFSEV